MDFICTFIHLYGFRVHNVGTLTFFIFCQNFLLIKLENQLIKLSVIKKLACLIKESLNILKQLIENKIFYIILCECK